MNYICEKEFEAYGYKCAAMFMRMGHRCGYVGVPKTHPLYGKEYTERIPEKIKDHPDAEVVNVVAALSLVGEEWFNIYNFFQVHGGITYSGGDPKYPVKNDGLWWFGFDCAHYGDAVDEEACIKYFGNNSGRLFMNESDEVVRDLGYVVEQATELARQLKAYEKKHVDD